jgi:hypothetical protein
VAVLQHDVVSWRCVIFRKIIEQFAWQFRKWIIIRSQDTSFGYHDGENIIAEVSYARSIPSTSFNPCSVSSVSSEETNHSCGSRKRKMTLNSFFLPYCSHTWELAPAYEHRAEFPQFLNLGQSVWLLGRVINSLQGLYLYTNTEKRTHIHKH